MNVRKGFTLIEMLVAVAVMSLTITAAVGLWIFFMYKTHRARTQAELDMDVRNVIERFRTEVRNTARETIVFYPGQREPYEAVSFALAADDDGDGLMDMDAGGTNILWRQTVVYHVWNRSPYQMRRTLFRNRNPDASYADRYNQVAAVVMSGEGEGACLAGESATTSVMFQNLHTGRLWHATARFDGYAPRPNVSEKITFGSLPLAPGAHTVNFKIVGKNPDASARRLRLDQVSASVSGWPLEAERCRAEGVSAGPRFIGQGLSSAAYGLNAATSAEGDTLSLTLRNDMIEECIFIGEGRNVGLSNTVVRFDTTNAPAPFLDGVYVAKLDGQYKTAWWGSVQAEMNHNLDKAGRDHANADYRFKPTTNYAVRIPIFGAYVRADGYGPVFRMYKSFYNGGLQIYDPAYALTTNLASPSIESDEEWHRLSFWQNGVKKVNWASCVAGGVDLRPEEPLQLVSAGQGFMFSCRMVPAAPGSDAIRAFDITSAAGKAWTCWAVPGTPAETEEIARQNNWTGFGVQSLCRDDSSATAILPGLVCMTVNYAEAGEYTSTVFDTRDEQGTAKTVSWEVDTPPGSTFKLYARGGNTRTADGFGIADATSWQGVGEAADGSGFTGCEGRYVQFRCAFAAQQARTYPAVGGAVGAVGMGPYRSDTPRVRRVCFEWPGAEKYVDVSATVLKGPDCGIFAVDVDGRELVRGVTMEIEIFKDVRTQTGRRERLRSAMMAEVEPRNSGK